MEGEDKIMPYIKEKDRGQYNGYIRNITNIINRLPKPNKSGHLNYIITKILLGTEPKRYNDYNTLIGVLECAKLELYRRQIAKYEEEKIVENGDI